MHPTNDVCFSGLMENPVVRKGFCAAILRISPDEIQDTELLPTHLHREYVDDKLGILDVLVRLPGGIKINMEMQIKDFEFWDERALFYLSKMYTGQLKSGEDYENLQKCIHVSILDFVHFPEDNRCFRTLHFRDDDTGKVYSNKLELQILELKKLPPEVRTEEDIIRWMRFFNGKSREDFENMAKSSEYLGEAYEVLQRLSADDKKRIEYEAREKAIRDHNALMNSAIRRGHLEGLEEGRKEGREEGRNEGREEGRKEGREEGRNEGREEGRNEGREEGRNEGIHEGIKLVRRVDSLHDKGATNAQIAQECTISVEEVDKILGTGHFSS